MTTNKLFGNKYGTELLSDIAANAPINSNIHAFKQTNIDSLVGLSGPIYDDDTKQTGLDNIDKVISLIRSSSNADQAKEKLISEFKLSEIQSKAIVEMRLRQLTGLEQDKLRGEFDDLMKTIKDLKDILDSE